MSAVPPVEAVLAPPTLDGRLAALRAAGHDAAATLGALVDAAEELAAGDPRRGRELAEVCVAAAHDADRAHLRPRAQYVQAQASARDGRLDEAMALLEAARAGWTDLGEPLRALRTGLGRIHLEDKAGRHDAALATAAAMLAELDHIDAQAGGRPPADHVELRAMVHQNMSTTHGCAGRWEEVIAESRRAGELFATIGADERTTALHENTGIAFAQLARVDEALAEFDLAVAGHARDGNALGHAGCLIEAGRARLLRGEYRAALDVLDEAAAVLEPLGPVPDQDWLAVTRADAYLALNLLDAASTGYEVAERAFRAGRMVHDLAFALTGRGAALARAGRAAQAERVLGEARGLWAESGNRPMLAAVLLELADLRDGTGDRAAAVALVREALGTIGPAELPVEECYARLRMADLLLASGSGAPADLAAVDRELRTADRLAEPLRLPQLRFRIDERLGRLRLRQGREPEGVALLERAVATVEGLRTGLPRESMRASFVRDKVAAHTALIGHWLDRGDEASLRRAFEVADRAKSRSLVDLMRGAVGATIAGAPDDPRAAHLRAVQARLDAVYNALLADDPDTGPGTRGARVALRRRADRLEREVALLRLTGPLRESPLDIGPEGPVLPDLDRHLGTGCAVLAYHVLDAEVVAFVRDRTGLRAVRTGTSPDRVATALERLTAQWTRFRAGGELARRHGERLAQTTRRILADLHDALVGPVRHLLAPDPTPDGADPRRLVVVPHGLLHRVPFHALVDGDHHLLERFEISYAPSAGALRLMRPPATADGAALVLGVPGPGIPAVHREVSAVAAALPGARVHLAGDATRAVLREHAPGCRILHLACHGLFRPDNPMFSAVQLHDGWLTAADVLELDLDGPLVALSACESGVGRAEGTADEVIGLPRAFLGAGAAAVLVSLWLVEDGPAAALMQRFYAGVQAGLGGPAALRRAQLALAADRTHPYEWAPFVYVGCPELEERR